MEGDARELFDTTALRKQKVQLEKGKSRLIDSYASAIIDKDDFEPKIKNLKIRLSQIDEQIEKSVNTESAQCELFLVIDRLEEFSKKVDVTLDTVDFSTKREIIRALVKRVEIYKEEVVVVFRIDPEAPANDKTSSTPSETGGSIMHSCNQRNNPTLRHTFAGSPEQTFVYMACSDESPEQGQETYIPDPFPHTAHQQFVMHRVKVAGQITFDHPTTRRIGTVLKLKLHGTDGVMHTALRPKAIGEAMKVAFPDRLHGHEQGTLYDPIPKGRNTQWPLLAVGLRDIDSLCRLWLVATCQQLGSYRVQLIPEIALHCLLVDTVDARRLCASRRQGHSGGFLQP
jgi:site-specific DNA recombinase